MFSYLRIKRLIKEKRELELQHQELTLAYIEACKKAGTWDEHKALKILLEQRLFQLRTRVF